MHLSPSSGLKLSLDACDRHIAQPMAPSSSFKVKYICPELGLDIFDISPITAILVNASSSKYFADLFNSPTEIISWFCSTISSCILKL